MTVVASGPVVFGDISEVGEIISILTGAVNVTDFVFADQFLINTKLGRSYVYQYFQYRCNKNVMDGFLYDVNHLLARLGSKINLLAMTANGMMPRLHHFSTFLCVCAHMHFVASLSEMRTTVILLHIFCIVV